MFIINLKALMSRKGRTASDLARVKRFLTQDSDEGFYATGVRPAKGNARSSKQTAPTPVQGFGATGSWGVW